MDIPAPPAVPGFVLETLVRFSRAGETWLAREQSSGEPVSVTLVGGALVSAGDALRTFRHDNVVPVRDVVAAGRRIALISPVPATVSVASLCAGRPALDPGEVVTIGVPIARALAAAHDRGIVHGDLDPVDLVIDADGGLALIGLGVAALSGAGVAPADDVHALALILRSLLGDDVGPRAEAIRGALGPALSGHPAARPEAAELAGSLSLTCPPQPLRKAPEVSPPSSPSPPGAPARPGRRRRLPEPAERAAGGPGLAGRLHVSSTAVTAALAVAGLLLLVLAAPLFGHHKPAVPEVSTADAPAPVTTPTDGAASPPNSPTSSAETEMPVVTPSTSPPTAQPHLTPTQWQHTLQSLANARDAAFDKLDPSALAGADAGGSSAAAIDGGRVAALRAAKVHAVGLSTLILGVQVVTSGAEAATLTFEESASAYDLVTSSGVVIEHRPASPRQTWSIAVVRSAHGWRTATATSE